VRDYKAHYVRSLFSGIPAEYDSLLGLLTLGQDRRWRVLAVKKANPDPDGFALDVATGTGLLASEFAELMRPNGLVVGVDLTPSMLQTAKHRLKASGLHDRTAWVLARAENLPFREGCFASATISLALRNVSDASRTLGEMARVTRPGGVVVSLDFARPRNRLFRFFYYGYLLGLFPLVGRTVSKAWAATLSYLGRSILKSRTGEQISELMSKQGLEDARSVGLTMGVVCLVYGKKR